MARSSERRESTYNLIATAFAIATAALLLFIAFIFTGNTVIVIGEIQPTATLIVTPLPNEPADAVPLLEVTLEGGSSPNATQPADQQTASEGSAAFVPVPTEPPTSYAYRLAGDIAYEPNANPQACSWMSIAGRVVDAEGRSIEGLFIEVRGLRFEAVVYTGGAGRFNSTGFEVQVHDELDRLSFEVQVLDTNGSALSAPVTVRTADSCERNVAVVVFEENPDFTAAP